MHKFLATRKYHCPALKCGEMKKCNNNNSNNKWTQQVQTDRTIPNNKQIRDNEKGTCMLIDVAISGEGNVIKKEAEKILKYRP